VRSVSSIVFLLSVFSVRLRSIRSARFVILLFALDKGDAVVTGAW